MVTREKVEWHINMGAALAITGQWEEALTHNHAALALEPNNPLIHNNITVIMVKQGRIADALVHFRILDKLRRDGIRVK